MPIAPEELIGCHVFEVGTREDVPFVTFGTGPTTRRQVRLVIESSFELIGVDPDSLSPPRLAAIMYLTVESAAVDSGWLQLNFDYGTTLRVSPRRGVTTGEYPWSLTDWYTTPFW